MRDPHNRNDGNRRFISQPNLDETAPLVCRKCGNNLSLHQPDPEMPELILGTCGDCKTWYLFNDDSDGVEIARR